MSRCEASRTPDKARNPARWYSECPAMTCSTAVPGVTCRVTCPYGDEIAVDRWRSRNPFFRRRESCKAGSRGPRLQLRGCSDDRRSLPVEDIDLAIFEELLQGIGALLEVSVQVADRA